MSSHTTLMQDTDIKKLLQQYVLTLDGAMGTMIQRLGLGESDFRGTRFADHTVRLAGCNDLLCLTRPDDIYGIHKAYLDAGADIVETNTFNANAISLADYGLHRDNAFIEELNREGARIAASAVREAAPRRWGGRAIVAGSMGPTNRTASMSPDVSDPAMRNVTYDTLYDAYLTQAHGLLEGGVDLLMFETVFDTLNLKAGLDAATSAMEKTGRSVPVLISATISDRAGRLLSGQAVRAFAASVQDYDHVLSLGLNCSFGPDEILPFLRDLAGFTGRCISCHPNAGLPNALGEYDQTPESFTAHCKKALDEGLLNIAGGCCGTTPEHIAALSAAVAQASPRVPVAPRPALRLSGLEELTVTKDLNFVNVGERCNVAGSRKFLRLIKEKNYAEAASIAAAQVAAGAMMIDINMDDALLDARAEMVHFIRYIAADPETARVPVMVDSSDWAVVEDALKNLQGKSIVNSISLKEGEAPFIAKAKRLKRLGAAVIVMAFDEQGQADTYARKIEVCQRAYRILTAECGFNPDDIIFDVNVMAVATGIEEHMRYGIDFIDAVAWIKQNLPGARTSGGVSNLSFAFRGKNYLREAMHAVFLYHAVKAGLDMGIVNPSAAVVYDDIEPELRTLIEDVVLARDPSAQDRLAQYASREEKGPAPKPETERRDLSVGVAQRLTQAIVRGEGKYMADDLDEALADGMTPVDIISGPLMEGMNHVGTLFGEGKMFLPQVVKTARTMKGAVDHLRPHMEAAAFGGAKAGKVLFATVKGDVHDIGKNIVSIVLACNNYEVIDLGVMVPAEKIVETALAERPDIICLSGLITPSLGEMTATVRALRDAGVTTPVMVGGATTSALHTALKIAPEYPGAVVHVSDASQNPLLAAELLDPGRRGAFAERLHDEQEALREDYETSRKPLRTLKEARNDALRLDWGNTETQMPETPVGKPVFFDIPVNELLPYVNWKMFFHAWKLTGHYLAGFPQDGCEHSAHSWLATVSEKDRGKAREALDLYNDARNLLAILAAEPESGIKGVACIYPANSDTDDIFVGGVRLPMLRQQRYVTESLSLADFVRPFGQGTDYVGVFAVTAGHRIKTLADEARQKSDDYNALLWQTLSDRLAEAASEWLHLRIRRDIWGYDKSENSIDSIMRGEYTGIRPAVGYPSLPDQKLMHGVARLLPLGDIGVSVTVNGAIQPSSSVCGLYISAPGSRYFMTGEIGDDQAADYALRRCLTIQEVNTLLRR